MGVLMQNTVQVSMHVPSCMSQVLRTCILNAIKCFLETCHASILNTKACAGNIVAKVKELTGKMAATVVSTNCVLPHTLSSTVFTALHQDMSRAGTAGYHAQIGTYHNILYCG